MAMSKNFVGDDTFGIAVDLFEGCVQAGHDLLASGEAMKEAEKFPHFWAICTDIEIPDGFVRLAEVALEGGTIFIVQKF